MQQAKRNSWVTDFYDVNMIFPVKIYLLRKTTMHRGVVSGFPSFTAKPRCSLVTCSALHMATGYSHSEVLLHSGFANV